MPQPIVTFDESGHTGDNLMNADQRCFTLASICLEEHDAKELLKHLPPTQAPEYKAKNLLHSAAGKRGLLAMLSDPLINERTCKAFLTDKPFMSTATLVDTFHYEIFKARGHDMHQDGSAVGFVNLLHLSSITYVGKEAYFKMLASFDAFSRRPDATSKDNFYGDFLTFYEAAFAASSDFAIQCWLPVIKVRDEVVELSTKYMSGLGYDPVNTSLFDALNLWGNQLEQLFDVLCDDSKSIAKVADIITKLSSPRTPVRVVGYGSRKVRYPLRVNSVQFGNSKSSAAIQVADLIAGTANAALLGFFKYLPDQFPEVLRLLEDKKLVGNTMFPSKDAILERHVIEEPFAANLAEGTAKILKQQRP